MSTHDSWFSSRRRTTEIHDSLKHLEKITRDVENKLTRHEFREAQVADFATKTLNTLNSDHALNLKNMKTIARQLANLEEKLLDFTNQIKTTEVRQMDILNRLSDGLNRLLMVPPPDGRGSDKIIPPLMISSDESKIITRVNSMDETFAKSIQGIHNEVKLVGERLIDSMEQLNSRHDRLSNDWSSCNNDQIRAMTEATLVLSQTGTLFNEQMTKKTDCEPISKEVFEKLDTLNNAYQVQAKEMAALDKDTQEILKEQKKEWNSLTSEAKTDKTIFEHAMSKILKHFDNIRSHSDAKVDNLEMKLKEFATEAVKGIGESVENVAALVKEKAHTILNALDDSAAMSENVQNSLTENFEDLTRDIKSLKKVEQVMLNTADAVLDTKRSIEFGIQQIILELSDAVQSSGKKINSTLSDQINSISFAILKNQSVALTNMTKKLENEISQVWRQIGIMYQQVTQSVDILDELQTTTAQQMNASLDKVGTMDGTVGAINSKVADVEDNLNYLLGRLSLVTSEFSHMKDGVGAELDKLRSMAQQFTDKDVTEYKVNKREVPSKIVSIKKRSK